MRTPLFGAEVPAAAMEIEHGAFGVAGLKMESVDGCIFACTYKNFFKGIGVKIVKNEVLGQGASLKYLTLLG